MFNLKNGNISSNCNETCDNTRYKLNKLTEYTVALAINGLNSSRLLLQNNWPTFGARVLPACFLQCYNRSPTNNDKKQTRFDQTHPEPFLSSGSTRLTSQPGGLLTQLASTGNQRTVSRRVQNTRRLNLSQRTKFLTCCKTEFQRITGAITTTTKPMV